MTIDQAFSLAAGWLKKIIGLALLAIIAITAVELLGFNIPGVRALDMNQNTGIGLAGLGFLYSKL